VQFGLEQARQGQMSRARHCVHGNVAVRLVHALDPHMLVTDRSFGVLYARPMSLHELDVPRVHLIQPLLKLVSLLQEHLHFVCLRLNALNLAPYNILLGLSLCLYSGSDFVFCL
jgi:hypothetical protein